jgi:phosphatidylserine decarboxylase
MKTLIERLTAWEALNFLASNRVPRRQLTRFMGWFSRIEQPLLRDLSLAAFRLFTDDLELHEARKQRFDSLHDCFVRELADGARPIDLDPQTVVSPCDAVVGAFGHVRGTELIQAKGFPYELADLLHDPELVRAYTDGVYVTLRLKANMYHRFHAPHDCRVGPVTYVSGDTWNVNPVALRRVARLFCKNERVVIRTRLDRGGHAVTLVAVAAILVASVRLRWVDVRLHLAYDGPNRIDTEAQFRKGDELGWFEHGSTIVVFAPSGFRPCETVEAGAVVRMGRPLLRLP